MTQNLNLICKLYLVVHRPRIHIQQPIAAVEIWRCCHSRINQLPNVMEINEWKWYNRIN